MSGGSLRNASSFQDISTVISANPDPIRSSIGVLTDRSLLDRYRRRMSSSSKRVTGISVLRLAAIRLTSDLGRIEGDKQGSSLKVSWVRASPIRIQSSSNSNRAASIISSDSDNWGSPSRSIFTCICTFRAQRVSPITCNADYNGILSPDISGSTEPCTTPIRARCNWMGSTFPRFAAIIPEF